VLKPDDAKPVGLTEYEVRHLATHLVLAGRCADLHKLLASETPQGQNLWFNVKEQFGDIEGFSADVRLAWSRAEEGFLLANQGNAEAFALQIRYSLMISSVRSVVQNLASNLIREWVAEGIWHAGQALTYVRQIADPYHRLSTLSLIVPLLSESLRISLLKEAWEDVDNIQGTYYRAEALSKLAPYLSPDLLEEATNTVTPRP
jgi:hypothetical protein